MKIDITMTAALRPNILERTLYSLRQNLIYESDFRLIIDIAPVGIPGLQPEKFQECQKEVLKIAIKYFPDIWSRTLSDSPQAEALKWTWKSSNSDFILQWEDDWELVKRVDLQNMLFCFSKKTGMLYFDRAGKSVLNYPGYKGVFQERLKNVWKRLKGKSLGGPPAILQKEYVHQALEFIDGETCLDLLSSRKDVQEFLSKWETSVYCGEDGHGSLVQDLGKDWKEKAGFIMKKDTKRGVIWFPK